MDKYDNDDDENTGNWWHDTPSKSQKYNAK